MKKISTIGMIMVSVAAWMASCQADAGTEAETATAVINKDSLVKRGGYLVTIMGCSDCHSPKKMGPRGPEPDTALLFSGHPSHVPLPRIDTAALAQWVLFNQMQTAAAGPWGVSFAANITPDSTGIGTWTEKQFFKAMREGRYKGLEQSRQLLPPMPWPSYVQTTDEDLRAIFYYLKSLKPVKNVVPAPLPPLPSLPAQP